ncbi:MAG TPA: fused MFS/spermidine synthase [Bryobacteraceae bacterium]|nr:fused MFS/spermidine synthase [Bryobacteraceae bacterium]
METTAIPVSTPRLSVDRFLPVLLILFAGSGCSALIYEVAWYQILQLVLGSTAVSLGILLATFMGGLCIGSLALPRMRVTQHHPLKVYAVLEFGIAVLGAGVTTLMPLISHVYVVGAEHGMPGMLLRGVVAAICMLPSTILMGASLPAIVRGIEATPKGVSWWALLYGGNTAGAVFGCLLAGFYLLRVYNMATAAYVAAAINIIVAAISYVLARGVAPGSETGAPVAAKTSILSGRWPIYISIALSGAAALGAEVIWTRLMGMLLLATVYVFSVILAVFLVGLAAGGAGASWLIRRMRADLALGICQLLLTLTIAWTAMAIIGILPFWTTDALLTTTDAWQMFLLDLKRCAFAILPPALLFGASFPLACAAAIKSPEDDPGRVAGGVYAANTLGGIVGALIVSLVLIPWIGTQQSQRIILALVALSALVVLIPYVKGRKAGRILPAAGLLASMLLAGLLAWGLPETPGELIAYGRRMGTYQGQSQILYVAEGRNSSVAISRWGNGTTYVNVNGHVEATTEIFDMKLQRMVGHLPGLIHPNPKSVLGIGFGAGVSAGTFTRYPGIQKITVCEIEPVIPPASTRYFAPQDYDVYHNPRTHIVYDDARHYLLTTTEKFDIIASDPLDVFVKGTAALYSKEYFESVKSHLNPGGMFSLYVPLYETDEPTIKSELETFFQAFPNATVWSNTRDGLGYDMVFMGQVEPLKVNLDEVVDRLARPDYAPVLDSLRGIGVPSAIDLFATYAGRKSDVGLWTKGAQINTDADLRLSYLAGWGINSNLEDVLYRQMLRYRRRPDGMFTGSPDKIESLYGAILRESSGQ